MTRRMAVVCQDASGHREEVVVRADTDESACIAALAILNSWRAVRVVGPSQITKVTEKRVKAEPLVQPITKADVLGTSKRVGPEIVKKAGPRDWIDPKAKVTTTVGRALLAAAGRAG